MTDFTFCDAPTRIRQKFNLFCLLGDKLRTKFDVAGPLFDEQITPAWEAAKAGFASLLRPEDRDDFLSLGQSRFYEKGSPVFRAGVHGKYVYLVESGWIKIHQVSPAGKDVILWFCGDGEIFGLMGAPREVFAEACSDTSLKCIPRAEFLAFLRRCPDAAISVVDLVLGRLYVLSNALMQVTTESKKHRLIYLLSQLAYQYGRKAGDEICIDIPITEQDVADLAGTSRQTVSTQFSSMKKDGILRVESRRIYLNSQRLKEFRWGE